MFKRKTDGMPNLKGQEMNEVQMKKILNNDDYVAVSENIEAASENATKADVEYYINQHDTAADAHAEILKKKSEFVTVTIPRGRMRGDANGDGVIDIKDSQYITANMDNLNRLTDDNEDRLAADFLVDANNVVNGLDASALYPAINTYFSQGLYGYTNDVLGNWTVNPDYGMEGDRYQFYTEIEIEGLTSANSAVVFIPEYDVYNVIYKIDCNNGVLRVYTKRCPISEAKCGVQIFEGDGSVDFVYSGDPVLARNFELTIPKGRMKGDVNGDGILDYDDEVLIHANNANPITDEIDLWCADMNGDTYITGTDAFMVDDISMGRRKYGTLADYFENWTSNPNYEKEVGQFYADINIQDLKGDESIIVFVDDIDDYEMLIKGEVSKDTIRVYASRCPISEIHCSAYAYKSLEKSEQLFKFVYTGKYADLNDDVIVSVTEEIYDDYDVEYICDYPFEKIRSMIMKGRNVVLKYDGMEYLYTGRTSSNITFSRMWTTARIGAPVISQFNINRNGIYYSGIKEITMGNEVNER